MFESVSHANVYPLLTPLQLLLSHIHIGDRVSDAADEGALLRGGAAGGEPQQDGGDAPAAGHGHRSQHSHQGGCAYTLCACGLCWLLYDLHPAQFITLFSPV